MDSGDQLFSLYRQKLDLLNRQLLDITEDRQELIHKIMSFKSQSDQSIWDLAREYLVFKDLLSRSKDASHAGISLIALIMETQAIMANADYPRWSQASHINSPTGSAWERMNPVLLMLINKPEYEKLQLKADYLVRLKDLN